MKSRIKPNFQICARCHQNDQGGCKCTHFASWLTLEHQNWRKLIGCCTVKRASIGCCILRRALIGCCIVRRALIGCCNVRRALIGCCIVRRALIGICRSKCHMGRFPLVVFFSLALVEQSTSVT